MNTENARWDCAGKIIRQLTLVACTAGAALLTAQSASALSTYKVLHSFYNSYGAFIDARPTRDSKGNFFGVSPADGLNGDGTVYELVRRYQGAEYDYKAIYNFCAQYDCIDGNLPRGQLIVDLQGNLYGTTIAGGTYRHGIVFELKPNAKGTRWTLQVLYNFCSKDSSCPDGSDAVAGLTYQGAQNGAPYDGISPLYGTTAGGGKYSKGIAYELLLENGTWLQRIIYPFCRQVNCTDGAGSSTTMLIDAAGNLYGSAGGGAHGGGEIFELSPPASGHVWSETNLYDFCSAANCADGDGPGPLIADGSGDFFGTTDAGGAHDSGTVFKRATDGSETVLYSFCAKVNCDDGSRPQGGVVMDKLGTLWGTTQDGGKYHQDTGTIFQIDGTTFRTRYHFCSQPSCADGENPVAGLAIDNQGNLFGTTTKANYQYYYATAFEFTP